MRTPQILAISSFVAYDAVGLRAIGPALDALGCQSTLLPTIVLSNHPGHAHVAGEKVDSVMLSKAVAALSANGLLADLSVVLTGYLPSARHVGTACQALEAAISHVPGVIRVVDPILGDDPHGLYIEEAAATAIRDQLIPHATIVTPNRFELAWLTGAPVRDIETAIDAARRLPVAAVIATSIPCTRDRLATVLVTHGATLTCETLLRTQVPHGTGDLLAGLISGHLARGLELGSALRLAHRTVEQVVTLSHGRRRLDLSSLTKLADLT